MVGSFLASAEQRPIPLTQNNRLCEDLGKHLLSAVTFTLVQQFHMVVEAEKTPNLLEELETWRKSSWEGGGSQQHGLHHFMTR